MHRPGYVQGGQEAKRGYLLLGVHYRRIHSSTMIMWDCAVPEYMIISMGLCST
jgi:hypothetical protein